MAAATAQAELRARAAAKFDRAEAMLFTRHGLEQATSLIVASQRARRLTMALSSPPRVLDLCCGIGGDSIALGTAGCAVTAIDLDPAHAWLARHNTAAYDVSVVAAVADVTRLRLRADDVVHVDPARRRQTAVGQRGGHEPSLAWCQSLRASRVVIKAAPGIDREQISAGWQAEWVSVDRMLKAAVLWSPELVAGLGDPAGSRRATVIAGDNTQTMAADPTVQAVDVREPGDWIIDPDPAVTRAGAVADLAARLGGWQIDPMIGFVCVAADTRTPFGRTLQVEASLPWSVGEVGRALQKLDAGDVQLRRRGLAGDVEALRRRWRLDGHRRITVLMTRHRNDPWALLCSDPPVPGAAS